MIGNMYSKFRLPGMMRSYHPENSRSHQNTELKPDWACLVLTWVTSGESQVTHCIAFCGNTDFHRRTKAPLLRHQSWYRLVVPGDRIRSVDHLAFRKAMLARDISVWGGLHISPRGAPSKGAKLCTYLRWFARPDRISTEPYYELPLPVARLRSIFHFRVGAHSLPVEQGRIEMPKVPRRLRRCTFCASNAIGDERHCVFACPHFQGLRQQHAMIFKESHDAMRSVMWHKDQKSVCALVLAIVNEAQTL